MATQKRTVDDFLEQAVGAGAVSAKPMFGEYGVDVTPVSSSRWN